MKTRILTLVCALTLLAAFPAAAGTNKFSKALTGGGNISFKVQTNKKGTAKRVTSINIKDFTVACGTTDGNVAPSQTNSASLGSTKVKVQGTGTGKMYSFTLNKSVGGRYWTVTGFFTNRKGRRVYNGEVGLSYTVGETECAKQVVYKATRK